MKLSKESLKPGMVLWLKEPGDKPHNEYLVRLVGHSGVACTLQRLHMLGDGSITIMYDWNWIVVDAFVDGISILTKQDIK